MSTYTREHAARLRELHERDAHFGVIGHLWADRVMQYIIWTGSSSLLDYGCGRSNLVDHICAHPDILKANHAPSFRLQQYDPATFPAPPEPADFVTCIDVLEHVEEECLDDVLKDIKRCTKRAALITISLRNGSNKNRLTHQLAARPRDWWLGQLGRYFPNLREVEILDPSKAKSELAVLVEIK